MLVSALQILLLLSIIGGMANGGIVKNDSKKPDTKEQVTIKQHFAPRFYFKRFANNNWLQTIDLKQSQIIKPQTYSSVCYAPFYYAVETGQEDSVSQEFEAFFQSIENIFDSRYDGIVKAVWDYQQLTDEQLEALALLVACLWLRSPVMRRQLNDMGEQMTKLTVASMASRPDFAEGAIEELAKEGVVVTEADIEEVKQAFINEEYSFELTNGLHLHMISECEKYTKWLFAKNWRFYLAKSTKQFITSDTPVIEIYDQENRLFGNHIMQRQHFFALTPHILVELVNPLRSRKRVKRKVVTDAEVERYNVLRARYSHKYCYAYNRSDIEDLLPYYEGGLAVNQAIAQYLHSKH